MGRRLAPWRSQPAPTLTIRGCDEMDTGQSARPQKRVHKLRLVWQAVRQVDSRAAHWVSRPKESV